MVDRKEIKTLSIVLSGAMAAYSIGEHLEFSKVPVSQAVVMSTVSSTSTAGVVLFNPMTFAKVEPAPLIWWPGDRQQQG